MSIEWENLDHTLTVRRKFCVSSIHPAETFPLVLAIGIVIQGLVFAGVQGEGLTSLFTSNCKVIAQFMWPGTYSSASSLLITNKPSSLHRAIYPIRLRSRMCHPVLSSDTIPSKRKMGCHNMLSDNCGNAHCHLDPFAYLPRAQMFCVAGMVHHEVWILGLHNTVDCSSFDDYQRYYNFHSVIICALG